MSGLRAGIDRVVGGLLATLLALAVLNVSWQVVSRLVLGNPSSFTDELARFLLIWIGLLGAGHAAGQRLHLAVDLLPAGLGSRLRGALALGVHAVVFAFAASAMVFGGTSLVFLTLSLGQTSAALGVPLGIVYAILPLTGVLIMLHSAFFFADEWRELGRERGAT